MTAPTNACATAVANMRQALYGNRYLPANVFHEQWSTFFFFDSDWISDALFVRHVQTFLAVDGATCACLIPLDTPAHDHQQVHLFEISAQTMPEEYQAVLSGESFDSGWVYGQRRFACAPDTNTWCMYAESINEIAVIAFRDSGTSELYASALAQFHAATLEAALQLPLSYGFSARALTPEWREQLLREYAGLSI